MSLIHAIKQWWSEWAIRRIEQDIDWARASSDAHIRSLEVQLVQLRLDAYRDVRADDIARGMTRGKLA